MITVIFLIFILYWSVVEQSCLRRTADNPVVHVSILFQILSPFRLLQSVEQSYLCCTVGPCWLFILNIVMCTHGFPGGSEDKASACNAGDPGLIPGLGRSLEKDMANHSSILAWRIPWTEEPGGLQSTG